MPSQRVNDPSPTLPFQGRAGRGSSNRAGMGLRKYHKWFSLVATLFILFFAVSGIILNHRKELSGVDVGRKWMPSVYEYRQWNLASVRGAIQTGNDSTLIYGNVGVWLTNNQYRNFTDWNQGFPEGVDNRKISSMALTADRQLFAGTFFGLFRRAKGEWIKIQLPVPDPRIVKVLAIGDSLWVMSRSQLFLSDGRSGYSQFREIRVPKGENDDGKVGLFRTLWVIHSGEIYGLTGKLIVDAVGIVFIVLCITGLLYFFLPKYLRRTNRIESKPRIKRWITGSLKWHNILGSWAIVILLLNTATGMFLRPPLLIPIASERVGKIPYTELDDPNLWFDRFRDLIWDSTLNRFLVVTSEGIFYTEDGFGSDLQYYSVQPPVSVMGINVFRPVASGKYLVGSFSGLFEWEPGKGTITDAITGIPYLETGNFGPPFGSVSVAGMIGMDTTTSVVFDYANGAFALTGKNPLPPMPDNILNASPMSLWSACLEIHTGRIFEPVLGIFYILIVPVIGLATLFILVSGFLVWWKGKRKKKAVGVT